MRTLRLLLLTLAPLGCGDSVGLAPPDYAVGVTSPVVVKNLFTAGGVFTLGNGVTGRIGIALWNNGTSPLYVLRCHDDGESRLAGAMVREANVRDYPPGSLVAECAAAPALVLSPGAAYRETLEFPLSLSIADIEAGTAGRFRVVFLTSRGALWSVPFEVSLRR